MKFDKSRVYTAINAEELKIGSKCIFADDLNMLRKKVQHVETYTSKLIGIREDCKLYRFRGASDEQDEGHALAYLLKEPQYKPFSSTAKAMEEISKHGGWVKSNSNLCFFVTGYNMSYDTNNNKNAIFFCDRWHSMEYLNSEFVFLDDDSPCGELEE